MKTAKEKIKQAAVRFVLSDPFFASIIPHFELVEDPSCPDYWTDGQHFGYNPEYIESKSLSEVCFILSKAAIHVANLHPWRRGVRDNKLWTQAASTVASEATRRTGKYNAPAEDVHRADLADLAVETAYGKLHGEKMAQMGQQGENESSTVDPDELPEDQDPGAGGEDGNDQDDGTEGQAEGDGPEDGEGDSDSDGDNDGSDGAGDDASGEDEDSGKRDGADGQDADGDGDQDGDNDGPEADGTGRPDDDDQADNGGDNGSAGDGDDGADNAAGTGDADGTGDPDDQEGTPDDQSEAGEATGEKEQISGEVRDCPGDPDTQREFMEKTKVMVQQAVQAAKSRGDMPGYLQEMVTDILTPKLDARAILERFLQIDATEESWMRLQQSLRARGFKAPGMRSEAVKIKIAVDTSASVTEAELAQFSGEINEILDTFDDVEVMLVQVDTRVTDVSLFRKDDLPLEIPYKGRGGTYFEPAFDIDHTPVEVENGWGMMSDEFDPHAMVYLTDGEATIDLDYEPDYPVLWITTNDTDFPFGEVIELKDFS